MPTVDEINLALKDLWTKRFNGNSMVYAPMQYTVPQQRSLVFVGMNPSFSEKGWREILWRSQKPKLDPRSFFQWPTPRDFDIGLAYELEALALKHYRFFAHHRALSKALKLSWAHLDLFAYRETDQLKVRKEVLTVDQNIKMTPFGEAQFALFEDLLKLAHPLAVIVVNALASRIYRHMRSPRFDTSAGYYRDSFDEAQPFPVFFSGMLTGARALDRFSRDRLFWQIASALGKEWNPAAQGTRIDHAKPRPIPIC